jgi:hypothetical protein
MLGKGPGGIGSAMASGSRGDIPLIVGRITQTAPSGPRELHSRGQLGKVRHDPVFRDG